MFDSKKLRNEFTKGTEQSRLSRMQESDHNRDLSNILL